MSTRELKASLAAADPVSEDLLNRIDFETMEAELLADLDDEQSASSLLPAEAPRPRRARRLVLATGIALLAAATAVVIVVGARRKLRCRNGSQ